MHSLHFVDLSATLHTRFFLKQNEQGISAVSP
jgi:hypothetical protein